jgi:hypothetical protein
MWQATYLLLLSRFFLCLLIVGFCVLVRVSLSLSFDSWILCLGAGLFKFVLPGVHLVHLYSCLSSDFEECLVNISSNNFNSPSSSYPTSGTPTMCVSVCLMMSHGFLRLCSLFSSPCSFCPSDLIISIILYSSWLILPSALSTLLS